MTKGINMDEKYKQLKAKTEIELGELAIINNSQKRGRANSEYYLVHLDGWFNTKEGKPSAYMFTESEVLEAHGRAAKNTEDIIPMKPRKWWNFWS